MSSPDSSVRVFRVLAVSAILHALLISLWLVVPFGDPWQAVGKTWVWFATSWLFWPIVLLLHRGRTLRRTLISLLVSVIILYPSLREYPYIAPSAFGLPKDVYYLSIPAIKDYFSGYHAGRADAENDLRSGRLAHEELGLPMPGEYYQTLQRYGIEPRIRGDLVSEKVIAYAKGYNEVSEAAIKQKFGSDVISTAAEEAMKHWKEAQANPTPSPTP